MNASRCVRPSYSACFSLLGPCAVSCFRPATLKEKRCVKKKQVKTQKNMRKKERRTCSSIWPALVPSMGIFSCPMAAPLCAVCDVEHPPQVRIFYVFFKYFYYHSAHLLRRRARLLRDAPVRVFLTRIQHDRIRYVPTFDRRLFIGVLL